MSESQIRRIVALDGGTTNTRARLLVDGRIVATAKRPVGVRNNVLDEGSPLLRSVKECMDEVVSVDPGPVDRIVAAGMLSSEVGLAAVPHREAPASLADLAASAVERSIPELHEQPILIVPGIRTPAAPGEAGWTSADLMRGEEVETFGAIEALGGFDVPVVFLWPGSHTKLVELDERGRITRSFTTLAGEITATLASQTLIAKSLPRQLPDVPDSKALAQGASAGRLYGLGRAAFLVRIADVTRALDEMERAAFWIGAVIAADVASIASHPMMRDKAVLIIGGREPQRSIYATELAPLFAGEIRLLDESIATEASALGAWAIAQRRNRA